MYGHESERPNASLKELPISQFLSVQRRVKEMTTQTQQNKLDSVSTVYRDYFGSRCYHSKKKAIQVIKGGDKKRQNALQF